MNRLLKEMWKFEIEKKSQIYEIEYEFGLLNKRCLKVDFQPDNGNGVKKRKDMISMSTTKDTVSSFKFWGARFCVFGAFLLDWFFDFFGLFLIFGIFLFSLVFSVPKYSII